MRLLLKILKISIITLIQGIWHPGGGKKTALVWDPDEEVEYESGSDPSEEEEDEDEDGSDVEVVYEYVDEDGNVIDAEDVEEGESDK